MIHIFYRETSNTKPNPDRPPRPSWFSHEKCFINLLSTIYKDKCKLYVVFDGDDKNHYIQQYINYVDSMVKIDSASGDWNSFIFTFEFIKDNMVKIADKDIIYLLENDYLHQRGWIDKVNEFFGVISKHYLTLYDHGDKYWQSVYPNLQSQIIVTKTHHWRTTPSTCGSFLMSKEVFLQDYDIHTTLFNDHQKGLRLLSERKRMTLSPIPGLSTHCQPPWLSPCIDWETISNNAKL